MRTRDLNFLAMAHTVNAVLRRHQPEWAVSERFAQSAQQLDELVGFVVDMSAAADSDITGAAKDKSALCIATVDAGLKLAKRTKVYATDNKSLELKQRLSIGRSDLLKQHGAEILATLKDWIARIEPIIGALAPYGILPTDLYNFKSLVDEFDSILTRPRELVVARKTMNQHSLPELLTKTREALESMDNLINLFEATPFEQEYLNARKVVELGSRHDKPDDEEEKPDTPDTPPTPPEDKPEPPKA